MSRVVQVIRQKGVKGDRGEDALAGVPIAAGTVLANPSGVLANPVGVDAAGTRELIGLGSLARVSDRMEVGSNVDPANIRAFGYARGDKGIWANGVYPHGASGQPGVTSFELPVTRQMLGDGSGYSFAFSKKAGGITTDVWTIDENGKNVLASTQYSGFATGSLPAASANEGGHTYDTTLDVPVFSNGTNWRPIVNPYATSSRATTNLNTLLTAWQADAACLEIVIDSPVVCNTNVTISKPVRFLSGGTITGTATITFSNTLEAPSRDFIFQQTGVSFTGNVVARICPEWFGVNGTTDTASFTQAVNAAVQSGAVLQVDRDVDLSDLASPISITGPIHLDGAGTITGPSLSVDCFEVTGASGAKITCDNLSFSTFSAIFNFQNNTASTPFSFSSRYVKTNNTGRGLVGSGGGVYWDADFILIVGAQISNAGKLTSSSKAIAIDLSLRNCRSTSVTNCTISHVGSVSNTSVVGAILADFSGAADPSQGATISDNRIYNVVSGGTSGQVFGILALSCHASIVSNVVDTVVADSNSSSPEGIYVKCSKSLISANIVLDVVGSEAVINMKGELTGDLSSEKSLCTGNTVMFRTNPGAVASTGINLGAPNILCSNNYVIGLNRGITAVYSAEIVGNTLANLRSIGIEVVPLVSGSCVVIKNNIMRDIGVSGANSWGVLYTLSGSLTASMLDISNNTMTRFVGSDKFGCRVFHTSSGAFDNLVFSNNVCEQVNYAFATTSTATLNTVVFQNNVCHDGNSNWYLNTATTTAVTIQGNTLNGSLWSGNDAGNIEDVIMITSFGESTIGGKALNTEAPTWQLAARPSLNFFNVNTSVFEALDIGTNNNLDHQDLNSTTHGPELELANACERGEFNRSIYYVQTGQGSSTVSQWDVGNGSGHWTKFLNRTNAAKAILAGKRVQHVVWMQIGQNDVSSTNQYTFKGALRGIISRIKTQLPGAKIIIATIPGNAVGKANYNARINELNDDPEVVVIDGDLATYDTYHYDYRINRRIANRYIAAMRSILGLRSRPITIVAGTSSTLDEVEVQLNAQNAHARIAQTFDLTFDRDIVQFQLFGDGVLLALDSDVNEDNWGSGAAYHIAGFVSGSLIYWSLANMGNVNGSVATTANAVYRFRKSGSDLHFEQRVDNGTWANIHTAVGLLASVFSARVRINATSGAASARVWSGPY